MFNYLKRFNRKISGEYIVTRSILKEENIVYIPVSKLFSGVLACTKYLITCNALHPMPYPIIHCPYHVRFTIFTLSRPF